MLLNLALLTSSRGLIFKAISRISVPMCSPSRSQSVQMKRTWAERACSSMFVAIIFLSWCPLASAGNSAVSTHIFNIIYYGSIEQLRRITCIPVPISLIKLGAFDVPCDASKNDTASSPCPPEIVVKDVILKPRNTAYVLLCDSSQPEIYNITFGDTLLLEQQPND